MFVMEKRSEASVLRIEKGVIPIMKRIAAAILCISLMLGGFPALSARAEADWPSNISISADGGIVIDARSGAVLYGKNMNEAYYPASITKILTALIIIENCSLDDTVTFSNTAVNTLEPNSTILGARVGDELSVRDCLYALLLQSANEVANALAEHCSGSIENFAALMNRKAESLGCTNSHFNNPSGLNDEEHYTTAYDMALIAKAAFENATFVEIDSTTYYDIRPGQLAQYPDGWRFYAHHQMLKKNNSLYYEGVIGGKTGYTSLAGNTLVTCAERGDLKLIAVVLNGHQTHYEDTKTMLNFGFRNFKSAAVSDKDSSYEKVENDLAIAGIFPGTAIRLSIQKDSVITLPNNGDFSDVTAQLDYDLPDSAPDTAVARIDYLYGGRKVGQAYLEAVQSSGYGSDEMSGNASGNASGEVSTIEVTKRAAEETTAAAVREELQEAAEAVKTLPPTVLVVLRVLFVIVVLAAICAAVYGLIKLRAHRAERERLDRQERREKRLKSWGYAAGEFDKLKEKHRAVREKKEAPFPKGEEASSDAGSGDDPGE